MTSIAIIGFGEVGQCFAEALCRAEVSVAAYTARLHPTQLDKAEALGLQLRTDLTGVGTSDLVLSVVPGHAAASVARTVLPSLNPHAIYVDFTAAPTAEKRAFAEANYVDAAIMGAVSLHGAATPVLAAGPQAEAVASLLNPLGFAVEVIRNAVPGDATALKLLRSLFTKGLDALVAECMLLAEEQGVREALIDTFTDLDALPMRQLVAMFLRTHPVHARRRLHEMRSVQEEAVAAGLPSIMLPAIIARLQRTIDLASRMPYAAPPSDADGQAGLAWLLAAERAAATTGSLPHA
jgi:3-hydroxyisobutyrate dehydrogenase